VWTCDSGAPAAIIARRAACVGTVSVTERSFAQPISRASALAGGRQRMERTSGRPNSFAAIAPALAAAADQAWTTWAAASRAASRIRQPHRYAEPRGRWTARTARAKSG
jgi:hypothetical protein